MTTISKCTTKAWATTNKNKPNMYTSFSKHERQYDPCRGKKLTIQGPILSESVGDNSKSVGDNKQAKYVYLVL